MTNKSRLGRWYENALQGKPGAKAAVTAFAVASVAGLTWSAVSLTAHDDDHNLKLDPQPALPPCVYTPTSIQKSVGLPTFNAASASRPYMATLHTNKGDIILHVLAKSAPCAANSFSFLARKDYFDDSKCHRLTTKDIYVLECGDPAGKGTADPGYQFPDENLDGAVYAAGTVALSKATPGRNGSQFFISYADPGVHMPPSWTPFAKVVKGLDLLKDIASEGTANGTTDGSPKEPVVIESVNLS
ncbi:peptidylprolyl isomerase [Streptomyces sp. NBC_01619]|uniref:peptidylprolyl isomerase n=1 Tax=Streptomyces sp. NBC_01619 TaxID=2975901 RepID=UPI00225422C6|nr:peptidylprolyl isomerase [Streptomyces sp. NBC_01619]MCX4515867.1 peptidylprolyl isomerase [Streptomyces sp. NBC_01619]